MLYPKAVVIITAEAGEASRINMFSVPLGHSPICMCKQMNINTSVSDAALLGPCFVMHWIYYAFKTFAKGQNTHKSEYDGYITPPPPLVDLMHCSFSFVSEGIDSKKSNRTKNWKLVH